MCLFNTQLNLRTVCCQHSQNSHSRLRTFTCASTPSFSSSASANRCIRFLRTPSDVSAETGRLSSVPNSRTWSNDSDSSSPLTSVSSVRSRVSTRTVRTRDRRRVAVLQRRRGARGRRNSANCSATSGSPRARSTRCATCLSRRSTCSSRASPTRRRSSGSHPQSSTRFLAFYACAFCYRLELANLLWEVDSTSAFETLQDRTVSNNANPVVFLEVLSLLVITVFSFGFIVADIKLLLVHTRRINRIYCTDISLLEPAKIFFHFGQIITIIYFLKFCKKYSDLT